MGPYGYWGSGTRVSAKESSVLLLSQSLLAVRSICDGKALFSKGSRESEEFKHFNGLFSYFL